MPSRHSDTILLIISVASMDKTAIKVPRFVYEVYHIKVHITFSHYIRTDC